MPPAGLHRSHRSLGAPPLTPAKGAFRWPVELAHIRHVADLALKQSSTCASLRRTAPSALSRVPERLPQGFAHGNGSVLLRFLCSWPVPAPTHLLTASNAASNSQTLSGGVRSERPNPATGRHKPFPPFGAGIKSFDALSEPVPEPYHIFHGTRQDSL